MWTRLTWIVAILALVSMGVLMACGAKYSASANGLVVVPTQGSAVMETFSLDLANGRVTSINNVNGPPTPGVPQSVILDPAGDFAYVIVQQNAAVNDSVTGIASFSIAPDGKLALVGTVQMTNPVAMAIDSAGKLLFVANGSEGTVSVFSVASGGVLTEVDGSPFPLPLPVGGQGPVAASVAVTPTVYPVEFAYCSGFTPPTTENLYVTDSINYLVLNYSVDPAAGTLSPVAISPGVFGLATGSVPTGVAVDPCNRFLYVSNTGPGSNANTVSAYTICSAVNLISQQQNCPSPPDFSLHPVSAAPYVAGDNPGPLAVDAYGSFLYVVDTGSSQVSSFRISPSTGALTALSPAFVNTGLGANSIAIRSDDSFMFVANSGSATVGSQTISEYAITPATGTLTPLPLVNTFNYPSGVAVK
jgi:6-phosphogluconolactonase (cycloisomerase 2 family)